MSFILPGVPPNQAVPTAQIYTPVPLLLNVFESMFMNSKHFCHKCLFGFGTARLCGCLYIVLQRACVWVCVRCMICSGCVRGGVCGRVRACILSCEMLQGHVHGQVM